MLHDSVLLPVCQCLGCRGVRCALLTGGGQDRASTCQHERNWTLGRWGVLGLAVPVQEPMQHTGHLRECVPPQDAFSVGPRALSPLSSFDGFRVHLLFLVQSQY